MELFEDVTIFVVSIRNFGLIGIIMTQQQFFKRGVVGCKIVSAKAFSTQAFPSKSIISMQGRRD